MDQQVEDKPKTKEEVKDVMFSVARLTGGFETLIKEVEPSLTLGQWAALDLLVKGGDCRPFELSKKLSISRQLAWQTGKKLERLELATVSEPAEQTRAVTLSPTKKGVALVKAVEAKFEDIARTLTEEKPKIGLRPVRQVLTAVAAVLDAKVAPEE
ncbi:hypothetical protein [Paracoccus sp. T5]|uniref:hypothetical protein n=1 Tax=Paracoccus sp. T5 TaxID=3402161 RepID=UPI003ADF5EB7